MMFFNQISLSPAVKFFSYILVNVDHLALNHLAEFFFFRKVLADKNDTKFEGPEPAYERVSYTEEQFYSHNYPFYCEYGGVLPKIEIAYETWGKLNHRRDNAVLLFAGLSPSSHAKSHEVSLLCFI